MPKFCKKLVVIDAIQYTGDNLLDVLEFTGRDPRFDEWFDSTYAYAQHVKNDGWKFKIFKRDGVMIAERGDWIIKGASGENYLCKPDIFEATYVIMESHND